MLEPATFAAPTVAIDGEAIEIQNLRLTSPRPSWAEDGQLATFDAAVLGQPALADARLMTRDGHLFVETLLPTAARGPTAAWLLHGSGRRALVLAAEGVYRAHLARDAEARAAAEAEAARAAAARPVRGPDVSFDAAPAVGHLLDLDGLSFELIAVEPYVRKTDGRPTQLLVWRGCCATCGEPFDVRTSLHARWITKRCGEHRAPGVPATVEAEARQRAAGGHREGQR